MTTRQPPPPPLAASPGPWEYKPSDIVQHGGIFDADASLIAIITSKARGADGHCMAASVSMYDALLVARAQLLALDPEADVDYIDNCLGKARGE